MLPKEEWIEDQMKSLDSLTIAKGWEIHVLLKQYIRQQLEKAWENGRAEKVT